MRTYFKALIHLTTEELFWDQAEKAYVGMDPDTFQDQGIIHTLEAETIEDLIEKLYRHYGSLWELEEGRLTYQCDGEHDYRTPKEERIPFIETFEAFIVKVQEEDASEDELAVMFHSIRQRGKK